ncbi:hypothetical protein [Paenibacillus dendritiformis]|uniref:hypothetical protein n=1 Tax=Paenibacillus dendritiformis TaxID=130049 RepID=UPI0011B379F9|nr:hypothetical protein [Paenibacillus dendritiformis]
MRQSKPLTIGRTGRLSDRSGIRPIDDGIMAVPIPSEYRVNADKEMKDFIHRKKKCSLLKNQNINN